MKLASSEARKSAAEAASSGVPSSEAGPGGAVVHRARYPELWRRNLAQADENFCWPGGESYPLSGRRPCGRYRHSSEPMQANGFWR